MQRIFFGLIVGCLFLAAFFSASIQAQQAPPLRKPDGPDIRIEFLGAESGYAVGTRAVTTLCVIRNVGNVSLQPNLLRLRCYTLANLDYLDGQLRTDVPALAPDQSASFRWRLSPTSASAPLVVAAFLESREPSLKQTQSTPANSNALRLAFFDALEETTGFSPRIRTASIPHFSSFPHLLEKLSGWGNNPQASADSDDAWVGNDRVFVHVLAASGRQPALILAAKDGGQWRQVALASPLIEVTSGEDGQNPWREMFKWRDTERRSDRDSAVIKLIGTVGNRWSAVLTLEAKKDTGAVNGRLKLTARRNLRFSAIQFPRMLVQRESSGPPPKADGVGTVLPPDPSPMSEAERIAASHIGSLTFGISWGSKTPLESLHTFRLPVGDPEHTEILGGAWESDSRGEVVLAGATLDFEFRLFAFGPSFTVKDAQRFGSP